MTGRPACVVPLAGPDLIHPTLGPKPLFPVDGRPLIEVALGGRRWAGALEPADYVFVIRETAGAEHVIAHLAGVFRGCGIVRLPWITDGALLSALAGAAALRASTGPLIIDLADILFSGGPSIEDLGAWPHDLGGLVPWFPSDDPGYSYLRCEGDLVLEAAEKRRISDRASAGVYLFRDVGTFVAAAGHSLANRNALSHGGAMFVCPAINGLLDARLTVRAMRVNDVRSLSANFRSALST
jgi:hypothetical protein